MSRIAGAILLSFVAAQVTYAQPQIGTDAAQELTVRRTDVGAVAELDEDIRTIPDLLHYELGAWAPDNPATSLYAGDWSDAGQFLRFDMILNGLVNPPGPLALRDDTYAPFMYGPSPIIGFVEFNVDLNVNTGGEVAAPEYRYLGNVGRFGGRVDHPDWFDRAAVCGADIDHVISTAPLVDRSGEEFHIAFTGDNVLAINHRIGDNDDVFEPDEAWAVSASWLHRAHAFERFSSAGADGIYEPPAEFIFRHRQDVDQTTITLIFPLTNLAAAQARGEIEEPNNGSDADQASIYEGLKNLTQSVAAIPIGDPTRQDPVFQTIRPWESQSASTYLDPSAWDVNIVIGMAYETIDPFGAIFAPTDVWPGPLPGDFNANGILDAGDIIEFDVFLSDNDGSSLTDADGVVNGIVIIPNFGPNFCMYDLDYDGDIDNSDRKEIVIMGDLNFDNAVDVGDLAEFVTLLLSSATEPDPISPSPSVEKFRRANFFADDIINGKDIPGFVDRFLAE
ncbi:MAG TPA: hypothetical protein P5081_01165 [Phycisphaerae bacterium]|nr:hypothetical protein [Phycisphaerae bacterium]HRW51463.1 hypothetical protein [Phycisphaerae bacterium]